MSKGSTKNLESQFSHWEKIKDLTDQYIDIMLNYRQSGHPGGSRSKVHSLITLLFSGEFIWDIRHPENPLSDRFILSAGHTAPLIYGLFSVLNDAFRIRYKLEQDKTFHIPEDKAVLPEDLASLRYIKGLSGHAEMSGKTLFLKWNTGPSGHGLPAAVGQALALKKAGLDNVRVFALEGEGGLTPGASHESKNSAWGLGLDNLYFMVDWNDYGIDKRPTSSVVFGSPKEWFEPYGWDVINANDGSNWTDLTNGLNQITLTDNNKRPKMLYFKTRKGRGYNLYDAPSHGKPHSINSELYWKGMDEFASKYKTSFKHLIQTPIDSIIERREQCLEAVKVVSKVLENDNELVFYITNRLIELTEMLKVRKDKIISFDKNPMNDKYIFDAKTYPNEMFKKPGEISANRAGFSLWGSYINSYCKKNYNRPLFIVSSADLAGSTQISGFGEDFGNQKNYGWYHKEKSIDGVILPQEITEFANSGIAAGLASVNFSKNPTKEFNGFMGAMSTYGSFSYLKYGEMRLCSQIDQDCEIKMGKVIWVAGHSGPETAEDARTHFGIFSPAVTQLFPEGKIINLYPWEHNEVPVMLAAAMKTNIPIIALHLTRPNVTVPDRKKLGIDSYFEASKGAYIIRSYKENEEKMGTIFVQGTSCTSYIVDLLPILDKENINVKIIAAVSPELFKMQTLEYQACIASESDWNNSTIISNMSKKAMADWIGNKISVEYSMTSDFDNRWRTGGTVEEVCNEAHISPEWILKGIRKFASEKEERLKRLAK